MTLTLVSPDGHPILWVRPAPPLDPPYDDERPGDLSAVCTGQLELPRPTRIRAHPPTPAGQTSSPMPAQPCAESRVAAQRFVSICIEVLNGFRPIAHLRPLATALEYAKITNQLTRRAVRIRMSHERGAVPGRSASAGPVGPASTAGVALRRMRVCEPRSGVAEAAAVLAHGEATFAMAVRLEHRRGQWYCALLQVI